MFRSQLLWRLFAGYVAIILISMIIVGVLVGRQANESGLREIKNSLEVRSKLLAEIAMPALGSSLSTQQSDLLQEKIARLGRDTASRLTVISLDGSVIADSRELPGKMDNHGQRPEIMDARERGYATASRFSATLQQQMIYSALRVSDKQKPIGFVRVSLPLTKIDEKLAQLRLIVLFGTGVSALVALLLGFYFAKRFSDPLIQMTETADAISHGDYDRRVSIKQQDEIGKLAAAVNRMARSSQQRMTEIVADRNRLAMIFTGMVEGVVAVDQEQRIVHINRAAADLLGLSMTTSINQPLWAETRIQKINQTLQHAMDTQDVVNTQMRKPLGETDMVVDIYAAALRNENGDPIGAVVVLHDVSELDKLERVRRDFVANASHELKTPITAIRGLTETMLDNEDMDIKTRVSYTNRIHRQSIRLTALVADLMTISLLETRQIENHPQTIDFGECIRRSVTDARPVSEEKKQSFTLVTPDEVINVVGEKQAISQLVDNLVDNAIKYTPVGGEITVALTQQEHQAQLTVSDTGVGIGSQHKERIFERFYRVDKGRSRELGGTGLGLSIVKNIAEKHGGSVSVESQLGHGATFEVLLPIMSTPAFEGT